MGRTYPSRYVFGQGGCSSHSVKAGLAEAKQAGTAAVAPGPAGAATAALQTPAALPQEWVLTDTNQDYVSDEDVGGLRDGAALMVVCKADRALPAIVRERISFQPHPKTMTAAGDYE